MLVGRLLSAGFRSDPPAKTRNQNAKRIDMRRRSFLVVTCLTMASSCIFGDGDRRESAEHTDLIGRWEIVAINRGGQDINLDHLEGAIREIREATYSIIPASGSSITGKYTINDDANPKTIDEMVDTLVNFRGKEVPRATESTSATESTRPPLDSRAVPLTGSISSTPPAPLGGA